MATTPSSPRRRTTLRRLLTARGRSLEITKAGWLFITLTIAVGFAAINSGSNLLHVIFGAQIGLIIMSGVLSEFVVHNAKVRLSTSGRIHAGADATVLVRVANKSRRYPLLALSIEADDQQEDAGELDAMVTFALEPGESSEARTRVRCPRRGRRPLPPSVVATRFPFGLFVQRRLLAASTPVVIFPALLDRGVQLDALLPSEAVGPRAIERRGRSGEIYELREYRKSDPSSAINWPASARMASLVACDYEDNSHRSIVLQLAPGLGGDPDFERAVSVTSTAIVNGMREGNLEVGLRYGEELVFPPSVGRRHEDAMLGFLSEVGLGGSR